MNPPERLPNEANLDYAEDLYARFLRDPESVPADWRRYFESLEPYGPAGAALGPSFHPATVFHPTRDQCRVCAVLRRETDVAARQDRVDQLVRAYRVRGHLAAALDPLGLPRAPHPELDPAYYGLTEADMGRFVSGRTIAGTNGATTLRETLEILRETYTRAIGVQFMHMDELRPKLWLQERMEGSRNRPELSRGEQLRLLTKLTDAVIFEEFLQRRYVGAKRFSLEGAESLVPLLDQAIDRAAAQGAEQVVIGMAHRGRINVLANIVGKSARRIFAEFDDKDPELHIGGGDVKYHLGHSGDVRTASGRDVHVSLCFNPSHLEFVGPVALGRARAKQDLAGDAARERALAIVVHGDAAFAGQGVVQETLNMSGLAGYAVGGALHIVVDNQIGFTTSPDEGRTTTYATDVARMLQSPIFHVNGDDPEAVTQAVRLALDFRRAFRRDVVIDMYCYRRYGHNEGDEPEFTQPLMYAAIKARKSVREGYLEHLLRLGGVTAEEAERIAVERREALERELSAARAPEYHAPLDTLAGTWAGFLGGPDAEAPEVETGVPRARLAAALERLAATPEGFEPHPKIKRLLAARREMAEGKRPLDWATAEALAFATLAEDGATIRLTGQDSERGTFSQRHAVLHDVRDGRPYCALAAGAPREAPIEIRNSPLSEVGVLGFEYGYSMETPRALTLWEAQFGDFCNAAQVIVDQFLVSAEDKWGRLSGLTLLLPHGFEGQGPEHSSARLERFLALCAEDNIQVAQPSTPAQYFHLLRRQVRRRWRKPLIVMTPKSLLRLPECVSSLDDLARGGFRRVVPDAGGRPAKEWTKALLCSGRIYYDLLREREARRRPDVGIVRVEQYYPLRAEELTGALAGLRKGTPAAWVQDEPLNMGAWLHVKNRFGDALGLRAPLGAVARAESASPAPGPAGSHKLEQRALLDRAFA